MRVSNESLLEAREGLAQLTRVPVRSRTAARIAGMARQVEAAAAAVVRRRDEIVERYADRDADGETVPASDETMRARGMVRIDPERRDAFEAEITALLTETVEITGPPLTLADLTRSGGEPVDLTASLLLSLGPLFAGPTDEASA